MMIQKWHTLAVLSNFAFLVAIIMMLIAGKNEELLTSLIRIGIIITIQISWNLLLYAIPKFFPVPPKEKKEPK